VDPRFRRARDLLGFRTLFAPFLPVLRLSISCTLVGCVALGCGSGGSSGAPAEPIEHVPTYLDDPAGPLPESIEELGLYPTLGDLSRTHARAIAYEPAYPLWSNGSEKARYLVLPLGERVDNAERAAWRFPVGTLFLKTFSYPSAENLPRPIETRVLRRTDDGFEYAVYAWDGTAGASLIDIARSTPVPVEFEGETFEHVVPSRLDCRKCHEADTATVIGFRELQLGRAESNQLERLAALEVFSEPPPAEPERIVAGDAVTEAVLGYLQGNCVHCHNGFDTPAAAFDLAPGVAVENLVGKDTEGELLHGVRVVPGDPEASVLYLTLARRTDVAGILPMPPVGVERTDAAAVSLIESWISGLSPTGDGVD
jgi:hypothetical protein